MSTGHLERGKQTQSNAPFRVLGILELLLPGEGFMFWYKTQGHLMPSLKTNVYREGARLGRRFSTISLRNGVFVWRLHDSEKRRKLQMGARKY